MIVMTYLKKFPMILEKVYDDGDDIFVKVLDDVEGILQKVSDDGDDIF